FLSQSTDNSPQAKAAIDRRPLARPRLFTVFPRRSADPVLLSEAYFALLLRYPDRPHTRKERLHGFCSNWLPRRRSQLSMDWAARDCSWVSALRARGADHGKRFAEPWQSLLRWRPELLLRTFGDEPNQFDVDDEVRNPALIAGFQIHTHIRLQFANKDHKPRLMAAVLDAVFWLAVPEPAPADSVGYTRASAVEASIRRPLLLEDSTSDAHVPAQCFIANSRSQYHHHQAQLQPALHKELLELLARLDSFVVQKCGLILLQLLPKEFAVSSAADNQQQHHHGEVVDRVCSAVVGALRAFPNALGVQAEGCVAALLLCRRSPRFAPCLVENDAFDCLFHIVRTSLKKRGLLRLAASACTSWYSAVAKKTPRCSEQFAMGNSKLARCLLELGANPNAVSAEDSSSLICLALASFQSPSDLLDTVYCLLEKGAVNTQSALEKSLTLGTDMVTGLLLKHLGYYKQGSFGSITWCNLKLQSFQARWLDPAVAPQLRHRRHPPRVHRRPVQAPGSAGAVIGLDDILPERYRLAQWTSASNPRKTSQPSETGSQQQLDNLLMIYKRQTTGRRQQQQQSGGGGMSRRGVDGVAVTGRIAARADSLGEVRGDIDKQQQSRQK
uniref:ANK_REP_REGION domain-containing protein n=1 Tax=Macrostomum lignano TaxID=282301 RepID=A0A1I8F5S9_9PLAT